jgi:amidase
VNVLRTLQLAARSLAPFFDQYDVLLTPTLATPPAVISSLQPSAGESRLLRIVNRLNAGWLLHALGVLRSVADKTFDYVPFRPLFNAT